MAKKVAKTERLTRLYNVPFIAQKNHLLNVRQHVFHNYFLCLFLHMLLTSLWCLCDIIIIIIILFAQIQAKELKTQQ